MPEAFYLSPYVMRAGTKWPVREIALDHTIGSIVGRLEFARAGGFGDAIQIEPRPQDRYGTCLVKVVASATILTTLDAQFTRLTALEARAVVPAQINAARYDRDTDTWIYDGPIKAVRSFDDLDAKVKDRG